MNNLTLRIKIKERCNKLSSDDFDNIAPWKIAEAFNNAMVSWCRRNAHGENILREGDEQSTSRIDDLQVLIKTKPFVQFVDKGSYFQTDVTEWPEDYLRYKRLELQVKNDCCSKPKRMTAYLAEEGNIDIYLDDVNRKPNYPWGETLFTITGNKVNIYHDKQFEIVESGFVYYRQPRRVVFANVADVYTGQISPVDVECEFNDDLVELLVFEAAALLQGDMGNFPQMQRLNQNAEKNN